MGSEMVQDGARIVCDHQGSGRVLRVSTRVKLDGKGAVMTPAQYQISGCPHSTGDGNKPCATVTFSQGATRVKVEGAAALLKSSSGRATGPLPVQGGGRVQTAQTRVKAT